MTAPAIILFNGHVATPQPGSRPAHAVAVGEGRILTVGPSDVVLKEAARGTETVDLGGRLVVPGFSDPHMHFYEWSLKRQDLRLDDLSSRADLLARVREAAALRPPGQWIMGQGWNETDWIVPRQPDRDALDRVVPDHPVLLWRCDLHLAVANTAALRLAGIDETASDPPEGRIERDATGRPTGILRELAINLVREAVPPPGEAQVAEAYRKAARALHRRGVTGIHDIRLMADEDGARALQAFEALDREGRLDLRAWVTLPGHRLEAAVGLGLRTGFGNDRLRIGHVKFFADGGMGARTAWMIEPFRDAGRGMPLMDMEELADRVNRAERAGLAVMIHAVGDRANRELVNLFEALEKARRRSGRPRLAVPHRIEHVQMIRPEDAARLGRLPLALCVTPANMLLDMNLIDAAVGEKGRWAYDFRRLLDTGAPVMFSSDCPVCDPAPLLGMHAAVTRRRTDGSPQEGWHPASRVTMGEALAAYTATPAAVHGTPDVGLVAPGKRADLAVLSDDVLGRPDTWLPDVSVDMTLFDGRIVHRNF